jgi:hypothetical protein
VASYPDDVLAARLTAGKTGALSFNVSMTRSSHILSTNAATGKDNNTITLVGSSGQATNQNPILWTGQARFVLKDGEFIPEFVL